MGATGVDGDVLFDLRLHWAPLTLAAIESPLAVAASVWLLGLAQRRLAAVVMALVAPRLSIRRLASLDPAAVFRA